MPENAKEPVCEHPSCGEHPSQECEGCNRYFCAEHGTAGGDIETGYGLRAYPTLCWMCGGFNADD